MLDKKSKVVLKVLNKIKGDDSLILGSDSLLPYLPKGYSEKIVESVLWHLDSLDYIHCTSADNAIYWIDVLYEGQNYKEFEWLEIKQFIFRSVLTPIFVAVITTLITLWIKSLL